MCELALRLNPRAMDMARRVAMRKPDHIRAGIIWASAAGVLGLADEAKAAVRHCLDHVPDLTLSNVMPHYIPAFRRSEDRDLLIRGLQQAGLTP